MSKFVEFKDSYTIKDIQDLVKNGYIELPPIQRGFVWKPYQIENLWDSLLRGFPIGCFICKKTPNNTIEILDGQQRLTSILLGLNWKNENDNSAYAKRIIDMQEEMKIFLDIEENQQDEKDHRKYNTRVITKFHPWGYQKSQNYKILSYPKIRKAKCAIYDRIPEEERKCITKENEDVYIEEKSAITFLQYGFPYDSRGQSNCTQLAGIKEGNEFYNIYNNALINTKIPFLYIEENTGETNYDPTNEEDMDSTEYLFTLINRGGTRISNDDLNYSLIKSQLMKEDKRETIDKIEDLCRESGIAPSRFVTICYFLCKADKKEKISLYISPTQFRRNVQDKREDNSDTFLDFLKGQISENLVEKAKKLVVYGDNKEKGIPYIWFLTILQRHMPLAFLMLYLVKNYNEEILKDKIIQIITILYLFDYKKYQRNTLRKLVEILVNDYLKKEKPISDFFKNENVQKIMTHPFYPDDNDKDIRRDIIDFVKNSKALLLYAQRDFLAREFENNKLLIDDMDVPFDYDHIFPQSYRGKKFNEYWDSIGNLRAWPYNKNRHDSNKLPNDKFTDEDYKDSFCDDLRKLDSSCGNLKERIGKIYNLSDDTGNTKKETNKEGAAAIIKDRIYLIYKKWYEDLEIAKILR
ncbi:MAG: DUF262 domain-containing protein [Alphaproteobacteria bacterium]|nr:DUF262 domain-containing protein [Alphaproteobacteria bacterium]